MKKKLKAFTLVELVIVMGMFTIIMFSVLQLLEPVSKYFVRSSNFEYTTSCVDNIKRAIDGNLKYADRVRLYYAADPYDLSTPDIPADAIRDAVNSFYSEFFWNRVCTATSGNIYVMTFDNRVKNASYNTLQQLSAYNAGGFNRGQINLYEFAFNNIDPSLNLNTPDSVAGQTPRVTEWYVNQSLYGNFDYIFTMDVSDAGVSFDPRNFQIDITLAEVRKAQGGGLEKVECANDASVYFSMKNVLDVSTGNSSVDYKIELDPSIDEATALPTDFTATEVQRYVPFNTMLHDCHEWHTPDADDLASGDMDRVLDQTCFFFVYTVPEQIFDGGPYVDALNSTPVT